MCRAAVCRVAGSPAAQCGHNMPTAHLLFLGCLGAFLFKLLLPFGGNRTQLHRCYPHPAQLQPPVQLWGMPSRPEVNLHKQKGWKRPPRSSGPTTDPSPPRRPTGPQTHYRITESTHQPIPITPQTAQEGPKGELHCKPLRDGAQRATSPVRSLLQPKADVVKAGMRFCPFHSQTLIIDLCQHPASSSPHGAQGAHRHHLVQPLSTPCSPGPSAELHRARAAARCCELRHDCCHRPAVRASHCLDPAGSPPTQDALRFREPWDHSVVGLEGTYRPQHCRTAGLQSSSHPKPPRHGLAAPHPLRLPRVPSMAWGTYRDGALTASLSSL